MPDSQSPTNANQSNNANSPSLRSLLIVGKRSSLTCVEQRLQKRLENLGYDVELLEETTNEAKEKAANKAVVVISPNAKANGLGKQLRKVEVPIVATSGRLYQELGLTNQSWEPKQNISNTQTPNGSQPTKKEQSSFNVEIIKTDHPLAARLSGVIESIKLKSTYSYSAHEPPSKAICIVNVSPANQKAKTCVVFGYESGQSMYGLNAPARRVAFGLLSEEWNTPPLTALGWELFNAAISWAAAQYPKPFDRVFRREWEDVTLRRRKHGYEAQSNQTEVKPPPDLVGLAFSGGGIRSATFCLGILQALEGAGWLRLVDYLSTVSGGGFIGGWWSAWLARNDKQPKTLKEAHELCAFDPDKNDEKKSLLKFHVGAVRPPRYIAERLLDPNADSLSKDILKQLRHSTDSLPSKDKPNDDEVKAVIATLNDRYFNVSEGSDPSPVYTKRRFASTNDALSSQTRILAQAAYAEWRIKRKKEKKLPLGQNNEIDKDRKIRLLQANRLVLEEAYLCEWGRIFPSPEKLEPERAKSFRPKSGDEEINEDKQDLLAAGRDPIHHLRLFSNYLIPRRGLLSLDTWGAAAYLTRNLALTWAILLPILAALILAGQLFFFGNDDGGNYCASCAGDRGHLVQRIRQAVYPLGILIGWQIWLGVLYLVASGSAEKEKARKWFQRNGQQWIQCISWTAFVMYALVVLWKPIREFWERFGSPDLNSALVIFLLGFVGSLVWFVCHIVSESPDASDASAIQRNRITRFHSIVLMLLVFLAAVLGVAGFGPDIIEFLRNAAKENSSEESVVRAIGFVVVLVAATAAAIYTASKYTPSGSGYARRAKPARLGRLTLKVAPPLIVLVLAIGLSWGTHKLVYLVIDKSLGEVLLLATCVGVVLSFFIALVETSWNHQATFRVLGLFWAFLLVFGVCVITNKLWAWPTLPGSVSNLSWFKENELVAVILVRCVFLIGLLLLLRFSGIDPQKWSEGNTWETISWLGKKWRDGEVRKAINLGFYWLLICGAGFFLVGVSRGFEWLIFKFYSIFSFEVFAASSLLLCLVMVVAEAFCSHSRNVRARYLLMGICVMLSALLTTHMLIAENETYSHPQMIALELIGALLTGVIALGWTVDPNLLSMHLFYRMRLVRGYLGASNRQRSKELKQVTQSVPGDDVLLKDLQNCERGGPYHLINTTLNMTAGSDLGTAQRRVTPFLLSKHYCGSSRTEYRDTREYMGGQMTLGTALAVSGAAATPSVQSIGTTSAQGMLLTLLNVRLGFWAPTPSGEYWRDPQARLWPFLTLYEFLSQTNDLASHCYLSDGAHFENTGIYSLVERGCRLILAADCGADPEAEFSDLGEVVRRCRIDFGAKIKIDVRPFLLDQEQRVKKHFVVGTITYSEKHLRSLNDPRASKSKEDRTGLLVLFKPGLIGNEDIDVMQYGIEQRGDFPQQTTADQFFDESQFESYRRLGQISVKAFLKALRQGGKLSFCDAIKIEEGDLKKRDQIFESVARLVSSDKPTSTPSQIQQSPS